MLFATVPKRFEGHNGIIQRNAINSWKRIGGNNRIVLLTDDESVRAAADELDVECCFGLRSNIYGTPLLSSVMELCGRLAAKDEPVCLINTDIILLSDFMEGFRTLEPELQKTGFMLTSERTDLDVTERIDFKPGWEQELLRQINNEVVSLSPMGIDYFIYNNGLFDGCPDFCLGRGCWDNWLIYKALSRKAMVVDCTAAVMAIHQNHDYSHVVCGTKDYFGVESEHNRLLAGHALAFNIWDASCLYRDNGIMENLRIIEDPEAEIRGWRTLSAGRHLVIYGTGWRGRAWHQLASSDDNPCLMVDREWQKITDDIYDVQDFMMLDKKSDQYFVIITADSNREILSTLHAFGYDESSFLTAGRLTVERMDILFA